MPKVIVAAGDSFAQHLRAVDQISKLAPPSKRWTELRQRVTAAIKFDDAPMMRRFITAVIEGRDDDLALLRPLACAESDPQQRATVTRELRKAAATELRQLYDAQAAYSKCAAEFDRVAGEFTTAAKRCGGDPEIDSDTAITLPDAARTAWMDCRKFARELDRLVLLVATSAELCGLDLRGRRDDGGPDSVLIALVTDPGDEWQARRPTWQAWTSTDDRRCGRWSGLHAAGVKIRALPGDQLGALTPYRQPMPLQERTRPTGERGISERFLFDPEAPAAQEEEAEPPQPRRQHVAFLP